MIRLETTGSGFDLWLGERLILSHDLSFPAIFIGSANPRMEMYRGNFEIQDYVVERIALRHATIGEGRVLLSIAAGVEPILALDIAGDHIAIQPLIPTFNRFWMRIHAEADEHVWGGGEQMSYFDLRGRQFPLWTSEPGVGRDKSTQITWLSDSTAKAGGDYWNTNYPQPTFLSSRLYALHVATTAYSAFDFRHRDFHEIEVWEIPERIELFEDGLFTGLVGQLSARFGRQPELPDWLYQGAILGLKDGPESFGRMERMIAAGVRVSGLWCEDWVGLRQTSFGKRLFWDWQASETRYPGLRQRIAGLRDRGIRFLGYVNPYLAVDGAFYPQAAGRGYLACDAAGGIAQVDFGEFMCGVVDFTNPEAAAWFAEAVIGRNMLDFGLSGWMADFGEYLPIDVHLANGVDARVMHNAWPVLWAEVNARAVAGRGMTGEVLWFMRAGFTGVQAHCPLLWAGDQSVDFSRHDGLGTVICGALSAGLLGNAYHHSDIGGYTSLFGNVRTAELLMRWSEMAAFTPVMRSHEGNRPSENLQLDQDAAVLEHFARMTRIWCAMAPYLRHLSAQAAATGLPVQRALFLHHQDDRAAYAIQDQYLYGADMLVAPVWQAGQQARPVYLPQGCEWEALWSGARFGGGHEVMAPAPIGQPAVFFRPDSAFADLFRSLRGI
ncbi:MAG: alpha-glucosidase [Paracoccus sp. (in: a-proteobacteria)]|nr:alpha-glucosidase [Paracoccus sp. (in: a-proteobacteria)]